MERKQEENFLSDACAKAWDFFAENRGSGWDYVILTASNAEQAIGFRKQIENRIKSGFLSPKTHYDVVPDPPGERVGNGGAMLGAMRCVAKREKNFDSLRVLVILSSGDSRRAAQYSAIGKIFSPVPRLLPNGQPSTLFDETIVQMARVPANMDPGMLVLSGDVLLAFDAATTDFHTESALAVAFPEPVETGAGHGVFRGNAQGNIDAVWHKQNAETLRANGAVDENGCVNIDTGAVLFAPCVLDALYRLICDENGVCTDAAFRRYVNGHIAPSLYVDFFYPLAETSTFDGYMREVPESSMSPELLEIRRELWQALRPYRIRLNRVSPSRFIHFGNTPDVRELMGKGIADYAYLGWERQVASDLSGADAAGYLSKLTDGALVGETVYLEKSTVRGGKIGSGSILSCVETDGQTVPENVVLHGLKLTNGKYVVRIYGVDDHPKLPMENGGGLFGIPFAKMTAVKDELWADGEERTLWNARLYPACDTVKEAVDAALNLYDIFMGRVNAEVWKNAVRESLNSSFNRADGNSLC